MTVGRRMAARVFPLLVGAVVLRVAVVPAEVCPPVTAEAVRGSAEAAVAWLAGNQSADGRFVYGYDRTSDTVNGDYNSARHGGVVMSLYQAHDTLGSEQALAAADRGVAFALSDLLEVDDWVAWNPLGRVPVGSNSLLLSALALRRMATGDPVHDDLMRGIGRFLLVQQQPDGSVFDSWDHAQQAPWPTYSLYSTGEAAWALALLDRVFPGEGWGEAAGRTVDHMATERDRAEGRPTRLPDHWAAYTLADLDPSLLDEGRVDYARRLAGYFGIRLRFEAQRRGEGINLLLRWYPGPPAGVGTAAEGIGALWRLARSDARLADLLPNVEARMRCTAGFMVLRQVGPRDALDGPRPELAEGAWFYRGYTQMDDQQHVLSSLLAVLPLLEEESR